VGDEDDGDGDVECEVGDGDGECDFRVGVGDGPDLITGGVVVLAVGECGGCVTGCDPWDPWDVPVDVPLDVP
jgi:hypothetical protein